MKRYLTEFIATFILVFCVTGASIVHETMPGIIGHIGVAISWGIVVMVLIHAFGETSGCHINPAVTLTFAIERAFPWKDVLPYTISQIAGAFAASFVLTFLFPASQFLGSTLPSGTAMQSFVLEILLMFFLMLVVLQTARGSKETGLMAGISIGGVVLLEAMFAGPVSGASMNPARSLAPAMVSNHTEHLWVYVTAPFIGAIAALLVHQLIKKKP